MFLMSCFRNGDRMALKTTIEDNLKNLILALNPIDKKQRRDITPTDQISGKMNMVALLNHANVIYCFICFH